MNLGFLRQLYAGPGPSQGTGYVSAYLDTTATEATREEVALRWRAARGELAASGADDPTLDAVAAYLTGQPPHSPGLAVFASAGTVRFAAPLSRAPGDESTRYAPLPHVIPLLEELALDVPHVRVSATREGARLLAYPAAGGQRDEPARETDVEGRTWPVHKVSAGGWSERRLQRSAEETWAENAKRIAAATAQAAGDTHAAFVLVGGDVRERADVVDALPEALRRAAVIVEREADPDSAAFDTAAKAESARCAREQALARLEDFRARIARADPAERRAVEGLDDTLTALRDGLAASVLLARDPSSPRVAWAADAAVRAACGTEAELIFVPDDAEPPAEGIGALLRAPAAAV